MKTTTIPHKTAHKNKTQNFKTIKPPTPHVDLNVHSQSSPITQKSKVLRKRKSTKIAKTKNKNTTDNIPQKKKTKQLTNQTSTVDNTIKNISRHTYINWPQQTRSKKRYYASPDSLESDMSFGDDELATLDEFESMTRNSEVKPHFGKKPIIISRRPPKHRRRQIDPTTCERDYTSEEIEFMNALSEYKRSSGRMFPTCSEILEVLKNLGYEKLQS
ncbi:MAG: hypothetical protein LBH59_09885 [Planctomycetaceae bacterium]|jgi:hypothetical protein|nr:hypothetical protein [Planctomycetaceae bacterium]